jgi:hypothetical protein
MRRKLTRKEPPAQKKPLRQKLTSVICTAATSGRCPDECMGNGIGKCKGDGMGDCIGDPMALKAAATSASSDPQHVLLCALLLRNTPLLCCSTIWEQATTRWDAEATS